MNEKDNLWTDDDIEKTLRIIENAQERKPREIRFIDKAVYWGVLIVAIIGNIILSIILIPFMLVLKHFVLYMIIFVLAFVFGLFFDLLLREIEQLDQPHRVIAGLFIPALAIINVFYMTQFSNYLTATIRLNNVHNPLLISIVYTTAFVMPYLFYKMTKRSMMAPA